MIVDMVLRAWKGLEGLETYCCEKERGMGVGGEWWGMVGNGDGDVGRGGFGLGFGRGGGFT